MPITSGTMLNDPAAGKIVRVVQDINHAQDKIHI
jgi:hypothetical protein